MTQYLISFEDGTMDFPEEDLPKVAEDAHAVVQEAKDAGVFVFTGGLDYRQKHGAFQSVDELDAVPGIGPKRLEQLHELVVP